MKIRYLPKLALRWIAVMAVAIAYFWAAKLGLSMPTLPGGVTPVWPASGIALTAILRLGYGTWFGIWLGNFVFSLELNNPNYNLTIAGFAIAIFQSVGNTLAALLGALLLKQSVRGSYFLKKIKDVFKFVVLAAIVSQFVSAVFGVSSLCFSGIVPWSEVGTTGWTWWLSGTIGVLIVTPALLTWSQRIENVKLNTFSVSGVDFRLVAEVTLLLLLSLGVCWLSFGQGYPIEYMLILFLVWAAFRFGQRGGTLLIIIISAIAIGATVNGSGPFVRPSANESLLLLESFVGVVAITTMALAAAISERRQAEETLRESEGLLREQATKLELAFRELQEAQSQLIQTEKMSSLGQLLAGVAHEINNPVNFIYGNINHAKIYIDDLLDILHLYQQLYPPLPIIKDEAEKNDLDFMVKDLPKLLDSIKIGAERILQIVLSLRNFSRLDATEMVFSNIHEGIDNTLLLLQNRIKDNGRNTGIQVIKKYGDLPLVKCYPGQLNQVFMNILVNAIDALEEFTIGKRAAKIVPQISICTEIVDSDRLLIRIADNGPGIKDDVKNRLFDPFFTTKPVGKGTGLGLSISYQIVVEKHGGKLNCVSDPDRGTEFIIEIPLRE